MRPPSAPRRGNRSAAVCRALHLRRLVPLWRVDGASMGCVLLACHSWRAGPCPPFAVGLGGGAPAAMSAFVPLLWLGVFGSAGALSPRVPAARKKKCNVFPCLSRRRGGAHVARAALPCCGSLACRGFVCSPPLSPAPLPLWGRGWRSCVRGLGDQRPLSGARGMGAPRKGLFPRPLLPRFYAKLCHPFPLSPLAFRPPPPLPPSGALGEGGGAGRGVAVAGGGPPAPS